MRTLIFAMIFLLSMNGLAGHDQGSGGDGLYLNAREAKGVIVPVPGDLQNWAYLTLSGVPGSSQSSSFEYVWCPTNEYTTECKRLNQQLNSPARMRPGFIMWAKYAETNLSYSVNMPLKMAGGDRITFNLKEIEVPKVDASYRFFVYRDYSDDKMKSTYLPYGSLKIEFNKESEIKENWKVTDASGVEIIVNAAQDNVLAGSWGEYEDKVFLGILTNRIASDKKTKEIIKIYRDNLISSLPLPTRDTSDIACNLSPNGACLSWILKCETSGKSAISFRRCIAVQSKETFDRVVDPKDGDKVSIFPGVYGIVFTAADGQQSIVHGIQAK